MTTRARRHRLLVLVAVTLALLGTAPRRSRAADEGGAQEKERTALYKEGVSFAESGRWTEALERFRKVVAIRSSPKALFSLGQAEEHLGLLATAERTYQNALEAGRKGGDLSVVEAGEEALRALDTRIPRIVVRVDESAQRRGVGADAAATVDGAAVALGQAARVDPGDHEVVVRASGVPAFVTRVHLVESRTEEVVAAFAETSGASGPPRSMPTVGPIVLGGAGVLAAAGGATLWLIARGDYDDALGRCGQQTQCTSADAVDAGNSAKTRIVFGQVLVGVGGAAMAAAAAWWLVPRFVSRKPATGVALVGLPGSVHLVVAGSM